MLKSNLLILSIAILLSSCATPQPGIQVQIQKEEVPIVVPCKVEIPKVPTWNFDKLTTKDNLFTKDQYLLADRELHLGYEAELLGALNSCIK